MPRIERMSMDGTQREVLHESELKWPNGLALDYSTQTLYWVDAHTNMGKIESCRTDGSGRRHVSNQFLFHPFSLAFHDGVLYWSDWIIHQVLYLSLTTNTVKGLIPPLTSDPTGVQVVSLEQQPHRESLDVAFLADLDVTLLYFCLTLTLCSGCKPMRG